MQKGELKGAGLGQCRRTHSSRCAWRTTSFLPTTPIPTAWSEIGWGGPASPRGYVRMDFDERDPWEAAEAKDGRRRGPRAGRTAVSDDPLETPRADKGRAPDVFRPGGWIPMREYGEDEAVDFAIVGTGAGGGTLACKLAEVRFFGRRVRRRTILPAAGGFRLRRIRADQTVLDR